MQVCMHICMQISFLGMCVCMCVASEDASKHAAPDLLCNPEDAECMMLSIPDAICYLHAMCVVLCA